ncbi:di-heme oxidoredictase family protein [Oceanisphaera pacifica]|uniref:Thiol oxidoreductase n=1 Tax=Oceanisphaera pacifica TaxID=2818389 RepID=A0ABS3NGG1_9GAMM|nr:di-heme oxidoredictase family protein [Oceanisphaera pacifica]MBO1519688.1 thiol oxidoreductase [Oceanisphaera pacifica]
MWLRLTTTLLCASLAINTQANPLQSGGKTTTDKSGSNAFSMPAANLSFDKRLDFSVGNSFFRNPWVTAPATTDARDGLGPLFNTNACQGCHIRDGRGHPPHELADNAVSMLVRLSIPSDGSPEQQEWLRVHGVINEPHYGGQLQDMAIPGATPEGKVNIHYHTHNVTLNDGTQVELRDPTVNITQLGYGDLNPNTLLSARIAPPMIGLGLLEAISETDLLAKEDPNDANGNGISGRANRVWDNQASTTVIGRFGWKAGQPSLRQQNASAFAGDMGITSALFLADDCTDIQACDNYPNGGELEVSEDIMDAVTFYSQHLAVPMRRGLNNPEVIAGEQLFLALGCSRCHTPSYTTGTHNSPALSQQKIYPYTDLLLHDMGEGLADHRPEFLANGQEWRTPPLWGLGYAAEVAGSEDAFYLHDGRARTLLEAILWHGGEAEAAKQSVIAMDSTERAQLIAFLESL